ncbi:hypothetical protein B0T12DRAFT_399174 [Alternaria alternata]|nr:hypothetical protein B0T12DRAFT_399174 [Alternaria alternata]
MVGAQVVRQGSGGHVERLARSLATATAPICQGESPVARLWCVSRNIGKKVYSIENRHSKSVAWHVGCARLQSFLLSLLPQDDSAESSDAPSNGAVLSTSTPPLVDNPKQPQVLDCSPLCRLRVYFAVAILLAPEPTPQMRPVSALCTSHAAQGSNNRQHYEATALSCTVETSSDLALGFDLSPFTATHRKRACRASASTLHPASNKEPNTTNHGSKSDMRQASQDGPPCHVLLCSTRLTYHNPS